MRRFLPLAAFLVVGCSDNDKQIADDSGVDSAADTSSDITGDVVSDDAVSDAVSDAVDDDPGLVVTEAGPVRGNVLTKTREFLGIPYAAPPIDNLRWAAPEPVEKWTDERDATKHGSSCPQPDWKFLGLPSDFNEDCLLLSVWTPNPAPTKAPVMVWFHGGGFLVGGAATPLYAGNALATRDVVVVGVNYRLGPLGFLAHPSLEDGGLNYAILDQQAALRWVKENISAFGGDPANVTIFGESAGGMSVCVHLTSPGSEGLFHKAVLQSGPCLPAPTQELYQPVATKLGDALGCQEAADLIECLRAKPADEIATALPIPKGIIYGEGTIAMPFIDNVTLPDQPTKLLANSAKVPVQLGTTRNEATFFVIRAKQTDLLEADYAAVVKEIIVPSSTEDIVDLLGGIYSAIDAEAVLAAYPVSDFDSPADALSELLTDAAFVCPTRRTARAIAAAGQPTYLYEFAFAPSYFKLLDTFYRSAHGSELAYVFGNHPLGLSLTGDDKDLAEQVMGYWTRFAKSGDPNGDKGVNWTAFDESADKRLVIDLAPTEGTGLKKDKCDFWDTQL